VESASVRAYDTGMDNHDAQEFLRRNHRGILHTHRRDGAPQMSPIIVGIDGEGRAIISSRKAAYKVRNLWRDPRASVVAFVDGFFGDWLQIDGTADIVLLPEAMEPLVEYYRGLAGEHPDWIEYRRAMETEERVLIRITIERAGPSRSG
jgi:PPOX class probable F420-dependent enzyme